MTTPLEPILAAPGAGLPAIELGIGRLLLTLRRWTGSREAFDAGFQRERAAIRDLVTGCDGEIGARRVDARHSLTSERVGRSKHNEHRANRAPRPC